MNFNILLVFNIMIFYENQVSDIFDLYNSKKKDKILCLKYNRIVIYFTLNEIKMKLKCVGNK